MKVSLQWLKDYIPISLKADALSDRLTMAGLEVESVENVDGDTVFELEITPNRPDCLSILGIAKEVSALTGKKLRYPSARKLKIVKGASLVRIEDKQGCPRYVAVVIEGVSVKPSEATITKRLKSMGNRAINNIVDITNFVLLETGQPLHAFDLDKLNGGVVVRRAKPGESIVTLDGSKHALDESILVIADSVKPVAIAGVMGGKDPEVTSSTKRILLESAYFDSGLIRRASRKLGISTDSSYRFERGVDPSTVLSASQRAADLILKSSGGEVKHSSDQNRIPKLRTRTLRVSLIELNRILGSELSAAHCRGILKNLGFKVLAGSASGFTVQAPESRQDIRIAEDVAEEVARVVGYDNLPGKISGSVVSSIRPDPRGVFIKRLREGMSARGFDEIITYSMTNEDSLAKVRWPKEEWIRIVNPLTAEQTLMRPTLLGSHLNVVGTNIRRGQKDLSLFEIGKIYSGNSEKQVLSAVLTGQGPHDWRSPKGSQFDFFDLKGAIEGCLRQAVCVEIQTTSGSHPSFVDGQAAKVVFNGVDLGWVGAVHAGVTDSFGIKQLVYYAECDLTSVFSKELSEKSFQPLSPFPEVARDVSLAISKDVSFADIQNEIRASASEILRDLRLVEEYLGEHIPSGQKGIVLSLVYQSSTRTLTDSEVQEDHQNVCQALVKKFQATIR